MSEAEMDKEINKIVDSIIDGIRDEVGEDFSFEKVHINDVRFEDNTIIVDWDHEGYDPEDE